MTSIEWTDAVWNPTVGCSRVSAGCERCYAERVAHRGMQEAHAGLTVAGAKGPRWTGEVRCLPDRLETPLRWRRPRRVFVDSMSDLFHESVPDQFIAAVFGVMAAARQHTFQVLTKRPERMLRWFAWIEKLTPCDLIVQRKAITAGAPIPLHPVKGTIRSWPWPLTNVWLGVSVEDQAAADERIPLLLQTPAAVRFLSVEPLLGPVDLTRVDASSLDADARGIKLDALIGGRETDTPWHLNWVIVGGESGPGARACHVSWIRSVVEQCREAKVACFVKQLGAYAVLDPRYDRSLAPATRRLRDRKGADPEEWPADLRVREIPEARTSSAAASRKE